MGLSTRRLRGSTGGCQYFFYKCSYVAGFNNNMKKLETKEIFCVFVQFGPVPPKYRPAAAFLFLFGLWHPDMGPALQPVCVCPAEPLQCCDIS